MARGCGLVPAAVAPCSPWPLTGGGRPSCGPTYLFPTRFNLGNKENYAGTLIKPEARRSVAFSHFSGISRAPKSL